MARRPIGRGLGTLNIIPGMPGDHPTSISGVWGRPSARQSEPYFFFRKLTAGLRSAHQLQNPAHMAAYTTWSDNSVATETYQYPPS